MSNDKLNQFADRKYLNLETYRKSGKPVRTPMWFAEKDGLLYVYTLADAGKVKRLRNNTRVRAMPCDARGNARGEWVDGEARILDEAGAELGHKLLREKYLLKRVGDIFSRIMNRERVVIAIQLDS